MVALLKSWRWMLGFVLVGALACVWAGGARADRREGERTEAEKALLPKPAASALRKAFPRALFRGVEFEHVEAPRLYEVQLARGGRDLEVTVSADGVIVEVETQVAKDELPAAVARTIGAAAGGAELDELEKAETRAVLKFVELKQPQVAYSAEFRKEDMKQEIEVSRRARSSRPRSRDGSTRKKERRSTSARARTNSPGSTGAKGSGISDTGRFPDYTGRRRRRTALPPAGFSRGRLCGFC